MFMADGRPKAFRAAGTRLRHLKPCASGRKPWSAAITGSAAKAVAGRSARNRPETCAVAGGERCGTRTPTETRCCCSGCSGCSCCGWRSARCLGCCSRTRRAPHASATREPRRPKPAPNYLSQKPRKPIKNFAPRGAARPFAADAATSDQRFRRWGTRTPTETRSRRRGRTGCTRSGRRSARCLGR